jgi:hypothetical protein
LPQHLNRCIPVNQFAAIGLSEASLDMGRQCFAVYKHPVVEIELFAG